MVIVLLLATACGDGADTGHGPAPGLDRLRGQWVFINYWAEWCAPCIKEIPELNAFGEYYADVSVVGVNFDGERGAELQAQLERLGVGFPTLDQDPAAELGLATPQVLPTTVVLDPTGAVHATLVGPQTLASLAAAIGRSAVDKDGDGD
jgi:thiol-disulfide isomerase/thioredoxin